MPRVFISYSHDSDSHVKAVVGLASRLQARGLEVHIDKMVSSPPPDWYEWTLEHIKRADFILAICTSTFTGLANRWKNPRLSREAPRKSVKLTGAAWEECLWLENFYSNNVLDERYLPVLFAGSGIDDIPSQLRSMESYRLPFDEETLIRRLRKERNAFRRIEVSSAAEFLEIIAPSHEIWRHGRWLFRGVKMASWGLTPSIFRISRDYTQPSSSYSSLRWRWLSLHDPALSMFGNASKNEHLSERAESLACRAEEFSMLVDFLKSANRNGLPVPDYDYWWMNAENDPEVLKGLHSIERWPLDRTLLQVAFAQHHGVPTRLLDWSYSPYSASWFAVSDVIAALHAHDIGTAALYYGNPDDANFCIWAIDASKERLLRTDRMSLDIVNPGYHLNPRINAQKGAFTLLRANEEAPETERIDHDKFVQNHLTSSHPLLVKIVAPHRIAPALLGALAKHGVTRGSIYPETESVERARVEEFFAEYIKDKTWLETPDKNYLPKGSHHVPFYLTEKVWQDVEKCRRPEEGAFWTVHRLFRQGLHAELVVNGLAEKSAAGKSAAKKSAAKKSAAKKSAAKKSAKKKSTAKKSAVKKPKSS